LLEEKFSFLHNFRVVNNPYQTLYHHKFNFEKNRFIDMDIQGDFDGSVNIIFTDDKNNPGIINLDLKGLTQVVSKYC
jgi:hypothetical protein